MTTTIGFDNEINPTSRWGRERHFGPSWYMESMWRDLPSDVLEKVVTFLPVASVLRFKTVSKKWNTLISQREFALRHARSSRPEEYVLITMRYDAWETTNPVRGWEVLDVMNNRFFMLSNDFLTEYVLREGIMTVSFNTRVEWSERASLAADGGLFCVTYFSTHKDSALLVCKPILKTVKQLPELTGWVRKEQRVVMSTNRLSMEYEVFTINDANHSHQPNAVHIYESKTGTWRTACSALRTPPPNNDIDEVIEWESVSTFIRNEFYNLFVHSNLVSYNEVTGVVSELDVDLPFSDWDGEWENGYYIQLVVSIDRLFCVTVVREGIPTINTRIEILETSKECIRLTEMPNDLLKWVLGDARCICY